MFALKFQPLFSVLFLVPSVLSDGVGHHGRGFLGGYGGHHGGIGLHGGLGGFAGGHGGFGGFHGGLGGYHPHAAPVFSGPAHYAFEYAVNDNYAGTNFGHTETREGYKTKGTYFVHLPDGRLQTVNYYADEYGFHPEVVFEGVAHHAPPVVHHAKPYH